MDKEYIIRNGLINVRIQSTELSDELYVVKTWLVDESESTAELCVFRKTSIAGPDDNLLLEWAEKASDTTVNKKFIRVTPDDLVNK